MKTTSLATLSFLLSSVSLSLAARPIARWDVIPDQRFSEPFHAGVCAFHEDGVKVAFSINGKPASVAAAPTLNPRTDVWEYVLPIDPASYPDGAISVGATATTLGSNPESFELPPLTLYANHGHSLDVSDVIWVDAVQGSDANPGTQESPLQTLQAAVRKTPAGGTVRLQAGTYSSDKLAGGERAYWTTIEAAPGVERDAVEVGPGRPGTNRLRWRNVTLFCDAESGYAPILSGEQGRHKVWIDHCKNYNKKGRWAANSVLFGNRYVGYVTGGITTELMNGPGAAIIRDHHIEKLASDVWTGTEKLVVNCSTHDVDAGQTGAHPDFHQSYTREPDWVENVILYNVTGFDCTCQGLFGVRLRNSAFVNVLFERTPNNYFLSQYSGPMENVLFLHVTLINQSWAWRKDYDPTSVRMYNCLMSGMGCHIETPPAGLLVDHNHFISAKSTFGSNFTTGDPLYRNPDAKDYSLTPNSPAYQTGIPLQCVPTDVYSTPFPSQGPRPAGACFSQSKSSVIPTGRN